MDILNVIRHRLHLGSTVITCPRILLNTQFGKTNDELLARYASGYLLDLTYKVCGSIFIRMQKKKENWYIIDTYIQFILYFYFNSTLSSHFWYKLSENWLQKKNNFLSSFFPYSKTRVIRKMRNFSTTRKTTKDYKIARDLFFLNYTFYRIHEKQSITFFHFLHECCV